MRQLDEQEKKIIYELIRNPRLSDNQVGKRSGIPIKTVNRKRKLLEEQNIIRYATFVEHGETGTGQMPFRQLYVIELNEGITRQRYLENIGHYIAKEPQRKHIFFSLIGERDGRLVLVFLLESRLHTDLLEIFNAELAPPLYQMFGKDCIKNTMVFDIPGAVRYFHNYLPMFNMHKGIIKEDWPRENIFVSL